VYPLYSTEKCSHGWSIAGLEAVKNTIDAVRLHYNINGKTIYIGFSLVGKF
jgi:hypothetical protein